MNGPRRAYEVVVVDAEDHVSALLEERLDEHGHRTRRCAGDAEAFRAALESGTVDAVVVDYHADRPEDLAACTLAKAFDASIPVIAIATPGVASRDLAAWNEAHRCIDQVVRKPLLGQALVQAVEALAGQRRANARAGRYAGLLSEDSVRWADSGNDRPSLAEMSILFTDIRRSTHLVSTLLLPEWFAAMNRCLTDQSEIVHAHGGTVVKYTGDGMLASFRGRGRAHIAFRCAAALQALDREAAYRDTLRAGIGVAEGLVMSGPIGAPGRQQYDVIGATVHLAARLCSIAHEGEIIATPRLMRAAGFTGSVSPTPRQVHLRGFPAPIECVSFPASEPT